MAAGPCVVPNVAAIPLAASGLLDPLICAIVRACKTMSIQRFIDARSARAR
jgi:hypothetical protein